MNVPRVARRFFNSRYACLAGLTALYLFVRLTVLFCAIDKVHLDEELYRGNVAKELMSGPAFPLFDYQRSEYEGGSLVCGLLAVPLFLLFGQTLIALKLVGLLVGTGTFVLWYVFLDRFFSRGVAVWASLLIILLPPMGMKAGVSTFGAQYEVNLFTIVALLLFYQIFFANGNKYLFWFLGAVCGFGLFFHYSFVSTLLTVVLFWFIFDNKLFRKREFLYFSIAFIAGFAPWIWYNLTHHFQGLIVCDKPASYWFFRNTPAQFFARLKDFVMIDVAGASSFYDPVLRFEPRALLNQWFISRTYCFMFMYGLGALVLFNRRSLIKAARGIVHRRGIAVLPQEISKETILLFLLILFVIILSLSGIQPNSNYYEGSVYRFRQVASIALFIPAVIVICLYGRRMQFRNLVIRYSNLCLIVLLLVLGLVSNLNFISSDSLDKAALSGLYRGYNYFDLGRVISWRFDGSLRWIDCIKRIKDGEARRYCYSGMGWGYAEEKFDADYRFYFSTIIHRIEKDYWPYAYEWIGEALERELRYDKSIGAELRNFLDPAVASYFYNGVGRRASGEVYGNPEQARMDFKERIEEEHEAPFYAGVGVELFAVLVDQPDTFFRFIKGIDSRVTSRIYAGLAEGKEYQRCIYGDLGSGVGKVGYDIGQWERIVKRIEEEYRPSCYRRLGIEVGWRFIHAPRKYVTFLRGADRTYRPDLYRGVGTGIGWRFAYDMRGCAALIRYIDRALWPFVYEGVGIGVARRYACQKEAWAAERTSIPPDYRSYFDAGTESESGSRHGGSN